MINGVSGSSGYSTYTRSSTSSTTSVDSKKFQEQLLTKLDTDGDGSISKDELSASLSSNPKDGITVSLSKAFSSLDSDDDDSLSSDELAAIEPPQQGGNGPATDMADDLLSSLDSDGDGSISSDELTAGLTSAGSSADSSQVFDALDTNKDGTVSLDELTAALQPQDAPQPPSAQGDAAQLFSALDSDGNGNITDSELTSALSNTGSTSNIDADTQAGNKDAAQALSRMVAALSQRYDTEGGKPVGKYLNTSA